MVQKLEEKVPNFNGAMAQLHCFLHITNLVVKSLMQLFDPKQIDLRDVDLANLEEELEEEDAVMVAKMSSEAEGQAVEPDNTEGGWTKLKLAIEKLHKLALKVIHSMTIVLPAWREICCDLELEPHLISWDFFTHWNSCCNMVDIGIDYHEEVDGITGTWV
ncbi:hypothetical protein V8B97DRAFT_1916226 [Scleroderma yunnanense]